MEEKSKILVISLALFLVLMPFVTGFAQEENAKGSTGAIFSYGTDAKSLAMGGAFVAVANNYSATYWNPAGLTQFSGVQLGGMNLRPYGIGNYSYGGGSLTFQNFALGGSYGTYSLDLSDQLNYDTTYRNTVFGGTLAYGIDFANFGASVKSYNTEVGNSIGFDLGTLMDFGNISLGVVATDVGNVKLDEAGNGTIQSSYRLGLSAELLGRATASAEVDLQGDRTLVKGGFEILPVQQFALRGGVQAPVSGEANPSFTVGAGINLAGLTVDIAWLQNNTAFSKSQYGESGAGSTLVLSAGFQFGAFGESD